MTDDQSVWKVWIKNMNMCQAIEVCEEKSSAFGSWWEYQLHHSHFPRFVLFSQLLYQKKKARAKIHFIALFAI